MHSWSTQLLCNSARARIGSSEQHIFSMVINNMELGWDQVPAPLLPPANLATKFITPLRSLGFLIYKIGLIIKSISQHHCKDLARTVYNAQCCDCHRGSTQTWLGITRTSAWCVLHTVLCCGLYYKYEVLQLQQIKRTRKHHCLKTMSASDSRQLSFTQTAVPSRDCSGRSVLSFLLANVLLFMYLSAQQAVVILPSWPHFPLTPENQRKLDLLEHA